MDIIEEYRKAKQQYFDKIIFKINTAHIKNIQEYNKLILYRNTLLENKMPTTPWDQKIIFLGTQIWKTRTTFFIDFLEIFKKTQKKIQIQPHYTIKYNKQEAEDEKKYIKQLQKKNTNNKTEFGPHKDNIELYINNENIKEHGSQGEKKLLKYILKLSEAEIIQTKKKEKPIVLFDDFFAKLDNENIMKIFSYFHRKFQVIITTTNTNKETLKKIQNNNDKIKIFENK